jgi:hypothetical protein
MIEALRSYDPGGTLGKSKVFCPLASRIVAGGGALVM